MMEAQRVGQVGEQLKAMEERIDSLYDCASKLEERLGPILQDKPNVKNAEEPQQELVLLANRIRGYTVRITTTIEALRDITARIEL